MLRVHTVHTVHRVQAAWPGDQQSGDRDRGASGGTLHNQPTLSSQQTQHTSTENIS